MADAFISTVTVPRSAPRFCTLLLSPAMRSHLHIIPTAVLAVARAEALLDLAKALRLLTALRESFASCELAIPPLVSSSEQKFRLFGEALKRLGQSQDPENQVQSLRILWVRDPITAMLQAQAILHSLPPSMSVLSHDKIVLGLMPILASRSPQQATELAAMIHDPLSRAAAYSWIAMYQYDCNAAQIILSWQTLADAEGWLR